MMARLPTGSQKVACIVIAACLTFAVPRAFAADAPVNAQAGALYEAGLTDYKAQRFESASRLLSQSFALVPQAQTLFAWAQSERFLFHCDQAVVLFDRFIAMAPPERQVAAAELAKRRCTPAPAPSLQDKPIAPPPVAPPAWYRDVAGGMLLGTGVVTAATGLGLIVSAHSLSGKAASAETLGASQSLRRRSEQRWAWGLGTSMVGALLVAGGITRYVWVSRNDESTVVVAGGAF